MQEKKTTPNKVLTWPPFLFLMLLAFTLSGCHYSPKMQVAVHEANKKCPVEMGSFGTATSIDYDGGMVVFNVDLKDGTADLSQGGPSDCLSIFDHTLTISLISILCRLSVSALGSG